MTDSGIWDEMKCWMELLHDPDPRLRPARMEVGPDVVDILKERFAPVLYPNNVTRWTGVDQMYGVPIVSFYVLAPGVWRIVDQFGKVMSGGSVQYPYGRGMRI